MSKWRADVENEHSNGAERWFKWLWVWRGCLCQMGWFECFRNLQRPSLRSTQNGPENRKYPFLWALADSHYGSHRQWELQHFQRLAFSCKRRWFLKGFRLNDTIANEFFDIKTSSSIRPIIINFAWFQAKVKIISKIHQRSRGAWKDDLEGETLNLNWII